MSSGGPMDHTLVRKSTLHVPQYVNMVNLKAIDSDFEMAAASPAAYIAGQDTRTQELGVDAKRLRDMRNVLPVLKKTTRPEDIHEVLETWAGASLPANILDILGQTPDQDEGAIRALVTDDDHLESLAMDIVETRAAFNHPSTVRLSRQQRATETHLAQQRGFREVAYMESFPLLIAAAGYTRLPKPGVSPRFVPFQAHGHGTTNYQVYLEPFETEALIFCLDPQQVLNKVLQYVPSYTTSSVLPLETQLGAEANLFQAGLRDALEDSSLTAGRITWSLMHTISHAVMKNLAGPSGFSLNSFSEYVLPGTLSFAVFVNRHQESGIGGLQSVFTDGLADLLAELPDAVRDCLHDPTCWDRDEARCHACVILSETSCRAMNAQLDRHFLYDHDGKTGFWQ